MKIKRSNKALTDLVGTLILLSIAIALFSVVNIIVFAYPFNPPTPSANLVGLIDENGVIIIKHNYGDYLELNTNVIIRIESNSYEKSASDSDYLDSSEKANGYWSIGDSFEIDPADSSDLNIDITDKYVGVTVVDIESDSVIMVANLQKGP